MFQIVPTENIIEYAKNLVDNKNYGNRYTGNGSKEHQFTGMLGECVICDLFKNKLPNIKDDYDGGVDLKLFEKNVDVKTMGRTTDPKDEYVNNFIRFQDFFNPDIYLFCSYNKKKNTLTICGWIGKEDFKNKRILYDKGTTRKRNDGTEFVCLNDMYEIKNFQLNQVSSFEDLQNQISIFNPNNKI
jgi:hypothetical protein